MTETDPVACGQAIVGHTFNDPCLLRLALTHASVADSRIQSNERLEFLGDAVLATIVCHELYARFGDWLEGELTKVKSVVVSGRTCAKIADETGLTKLLILGNGIVGPNALPTSVRAAVFEAVIGAIYLDGGLPAASTFVARAFGDALSPTAPIRRDPKTELQERTMALRGDVPIYRVVGDSEVEGDLARFSVEVVLLGEVLAAVGPGRCQDRPVS